MNQIESLLNLPEYIQIVIATGYIGHSIAKAGFRDKERKDELLYSIMVYGLFGYAVYHTADSNGFCFLASALFAIISVVVAAIFWRKTGSRIFNKILHNAAISNEDGTPDVWTGIIQCTHAGPTQVVVVLKDGTELSCNDVQSFRNASFPKYYTDNAGNIAFYVTSIKKNDGTVKEMPSVRDSQWGDRLTYIPASEISRVMIRFKNKD
ncbi:MAG: hypothetical protein D3908_07315 [Candidatus Electrothrix sp. AUS4]|nr:hypothetical protein [Candidatus Electrothrix sp. AUS4]